MVERLAGVCETVDAADITAEHSRDWWPLAMVWATSGGVPARAALVASPSSTAEVASVLAVCNEARVPVTAAGGRSGVCGASIPVFGGVLLDCTGISGIAEIDTDSMVVDVAAGTFGDVMEVELAERRLTVGHWPQSVNLSTIGGWLACRGAGQLSNRYGKIEDMVVGLDVVLADGSVIETGGNARAAAGPDLNQLFVGSEGTLGIITQARLRLHDAPDHRVDAAYGFGSFDAANHACYEIYRRGARPAILRTYDATEAAPRFDSGELAVLLVRDEGDPALVDATMRVVAEECDDAVALEAELVGRWWGHRNDVSALEALITKGFAVDTMEVTAPWGAAAQVYADVQQAMMAVEGTKVASAHQSHAYTDGACLYFSFAARPEDPADREAWYTAVWDAGTRAALAAGGSLSHHHGVGLNRSRFMREALGGGLDVLQGIKRALDPNGILNPGKLGMASPFGAVPWP